METRPCDEQSQPAEPTRDGVCSPSESAHLFHPWIRQALFAETKRVWSAAYGRMLDDHEVVEILVNVRRLTEALVTITPMGGKA
jgi:hypothetical protein